MKNQLKGGTRQFLVEDKSRSIKYTLQMLILIFLWLVFPDMQTCSIQSTIHFSPFQYTKSFFLVKSSSVNSINNYLKIKEYSTAVFKPIINLWFHNSIRVTLCFRNLKLQFLLLFHRYLQMGSIYVPFYQ